MIIDRLPFSEYCLLYCPHGTTWLPLDGFSWNLRVFRKPAEKIQVSLKCDKNSGCFTRRSLSFMTTLSWILFKMRYVSGKSCIESQNTHLCPKPFFFYLCLLWDALPFHFIATEILVVELQTSEPAFYFVVGWDVSVVPSLKCSCLT